MVAGCEPGEVVRLRAGDIDSEQMIIRVVQSKGRKDRHVLPEVLDLLRQLWKARPTEHDAGVAPEQRWLFPGRSDHQPLTTPVRAAVHGGAPCRLSPHQ
jgi:integrase